MTIEARRVHRGVSGALLALTLVLLAAVPVARADTIYPDNKLTGTSFDAGLDGWTQATRVCTVVTLLGTELFATDGPICDTGTRHSAGVGTPPGSLEQFGSKTAGATVLGIASVLDATTTALSTPFTVSAAGPTTFDFDVRGDVEALVDLGAGATYHWDLIGPGGAVTPLFGPEFWTDANFDDSGAFQGRFNRSLPDNLLTAGQTYQLQLTTKFSTPPDIRIGAALFNTLLKVDNIRLRVKDGSPRFGPPTVETLDATDIVGTGSGATHSATLNGVTNAQGLPARYFLRYSTDSTLATNATVLGGPTGFDAGERTDDQTRSRSTGAVLAACTTYYFRIEASNTASAPNTRTLGAIKSFKTDCPPSAVTEPADPGFTTATVNGSANPNGGDTSYYYEYNVDVPVGATTFSSRVPAGTATFGPIGDGYAFVRPLSVPLTGLQGLTAYRARIVAVNAVGTTFGNIVTFTTTGEGLKGDKGDTGLEGDKGDTGEKGAQGDPGLNGTNGTNGINGTNGAPGPVGPAGPKGSQGTTGSSLPDADSSSKLAMVRIDANVIRVPTKGRNIGRVRVQIFCRQIAVRTCSGTMKIRSVNKILPNSFGLPTKAKRRVTFSTAPVQLDVGKVGFAIFDFNAQRRSVLRREGRVRANVIVTVIDANNNRQNVRKNVTVVRGGRG